MNGYEYHEILFLISPLLEFFSCLPTTVALGTCAGCDFPRCMRHKRNGLSLWQVCLGRDERTHTSQHKLQHSRTSLQASRKAAQCSLWL